MLTRTALFLCLSTFAVALVLVACDANHSSSATATPEPNVTAAPPGTVTNTGATVQGATDPLANVVNKDLVKEPADESRVTPAKVIEVASGFTIPVRSAPHGGAIDSLAPSAIVTEIARDPQGDYYLVVYRDRDDASKQFAGWVFKDAVENTAWATQATVPAAHGSTPSATGIAGTASKSVEPALTCGKGESRMKTDHEFCAQACRDDRSCSHSGDTCDGLAFDVREGVAREAARYCVSHGTPSVRKSVD